MTRPIPQKPPRKTGLAHFFAAASYSAMGFRRLLRESAFRQELVIGFAICLCAITAVEALNTAIEELVDHLSPEWSVFAKNAKDLGSLAVGATIGAAALYTLWAVLAPI